MSTGTSWRLRFKEVFTSTPQPVACSNCFVNSEMDYLVIGNFTWERVAQPHKKLECSFQPSLD